MIGNMQKAEPIAIEVAETTAVPAPIEEPIAAPVVEPVPVAPVAPAPVAMPEVAQPATQPLIYGGANPLENTQSMPIMSTPVSNQTESVMPYGEASFSQTVPVTNGVPGSIQQ